MSPPRFCSPTFKGLVALGPDGPGNSGLDILRHTYRGISSEYGVKEGEVLR
ncbi:hypothetical protein ABLN97_10765 [Mycobacterium tuberculosis]